MPGQERQINLHFLAKPSDVNYRGTVHGGNVMSWIDQAGYACAVGWSQQSCVTVYVGGIRFLKPVHVGHLVQVEAKLIYTGRTSMHISVDVNAADPRDKHYIHCTHCIIVFVALDDQGKPIEVPEWVPKATDDKALHEYARRLFDLGKGMQQAMQEYLYREP